MGISTSCAAEVRSAHAKTRLRKQEWALKRHGYKISLRDRQVNPGHKGTWMVTDPHDGDGGYAIVGDDRAELVSEAYKHLLAKV